MTMTASESMALLLMLLTFAGLFASVFIVLAWRFVGPIVPIVLTIIALGIIYCAIFYSDLGDDVYPAFCFTTILGVAFVVALIDEGLKQEGTLLKLNKPAPRHKPAPEHSEANVPVVVDCGLLFYESQDADSVVYQPEMTLNVAAYVRPFAVFNMPELAASQVARVSFELKSEGGKRLFNGSKLVRFKPGITAVLAPDNLPLNNAPLSDQKWQLHIYRDGVRKHSQELPLCDEGVGQYLDGENFRQYLDGDGELSDQLVALLDEPSPKQKRSLDDLLQ